MPDIAPETRNRVRAIWIHHQTGSGSSSEMESEKCMKDYTVGKMKTDERGWPQVQFTPDEEPLRMVSAFLQEDVGIFLPTCEGLLRDLHEVLRGSEKETLWNGDRFLLRMKRDRVGMTDMFGEKGMNSAPVMIETRLLLQLLDAWREFVSELPRQREFAVE